MQASQVTPYGAAQGTKKEQVARMFDNIAGRYDLLNRIMSVGIDRSWRKKAIALLKPLQPQVVLDLATGTGDFAISALALQPKKIIGIDISEGMLAIGREKIQKIGAQKIIEMQQGDSEHLRLPDSYADAITVGFGVRNFENLHKGLCEMCRVLRPGGIAIVLEPSFPQSFPLNWLFKFYFTQITPFIGKIVSNDSSAYSYLPASVQAFPTGNEFLFACKKAGFQETKWIPLTFGTCALYYLKK